MESREVNTMLAVRSQFHQSRLIEHTTPFNPQFQSTMRGLTQHFAASGSGALTAQHQALGAVYGMVQNQATAMAFVDCFWLLGVAMIVLLPLVFIMRRPPRHAEPVAVGH